jgi:hypothetical protein
MSFEITLVMLVGIALIVLAGAIRRRSLRRAEADADALRERLERSGGPVHETHGVPPEMRLNSPPISGGGAEAHSS